MALTLTLAGPGESEQVALQEQAEEDGQRILRENWGAVEAVADALLKHRSLNSVDFSRILEEANCPRGEPVYDYELNKLYRSGLLMSQRLHRLHPPGVSSDASGARALPSRAKVSG